MAIKRKKAESRDKVKNEADGIDQLKEQDLKEEMDDDETEDEAEEFSSSQKKRGYSESEDAGDEKGPGHKKHKPNKVKRPTAEEAIRLREAENLFHSNLFRLQIEEMMKEVMPKENTIKAVNLWLDNFRRYVISLGEMKDLSLNDLQWLKKLNIGLPIPPVKGEQKGVFNFFPPVNVVPVGSFKAGCSQAPHLSVDLALIMPKKMFYTEDYLNQRYHLKRALYLSLLASKIQNQAEFVSTGSLQFSTISGDPLKPILVFSPVGKHMQHIEIFLHAVPEDDTFKRTRFLPNKNNLRPSWWGLSEEADSLPPTPQYNTSIIEDIVMETNDDARYEAIANHDNVREAVALLRVWLKQRELCEGYGAFSVYIMSMYIVHLMKIQKINHLMSSYQIVRNVWLSLSNSDWTVEGPSMVSSVLIKSVPVSVFHEYYDVVFVDTTGVCNLAARVNKYTYLKVKHEAELAIHCLDNQLVNSFQALFMTKVAFMWQYDHTICFSDSNVLAKVVSNKGDANVSMDYNLFPVPQFVKLLGNVLSKGTGTRITELFFKIMTNPKWDIKDTYSSGYVLDLFMIGLKLNSESSLRLIDKGPEANLPEAAEFRSFWEDKSELRRFQDGTVCESVVWGQEEISIRQRRLIISKIVEFLFKCKLDIGPSDYCYIADQLSPVIANTVEQDNKIEENSHAANSILEELSHQLRDLPDLPLSIVSVHCISSVYRYTDAFPPLPVKTYKKKGRSNSNPMLPEEKMLHTVPSYVSPIDLVMQLEFTQKWPDEIAAGRRLLASFNNEIAVALQKTNNISSTLTPDCLIVYKGGYAFRLFLGYSKEIALLKKRITAEGVEQYRDTAESIALEKKFINLPKISGALHGLSQQYPAYGTATCLAKRWLSSQLLDNTHFPSIIVELLVASLFISPQPYTTTIQPQTAFLRFLNLLATTNWYIEPVIINFNSLLTREQITSIEKVFTSQRETLPAMFVATPYDVTGKLWTQKVPTLPTLVRLAKLASMTLQILEVRLNEIFSVENLLEVFRPPMDGYDCLIRIKQQYCARMVQCLDKVGVFKPQEQKKFVIERLVVDFDPVQCYLKELRENYGDYALFFHDTYGGYEIGVLFKPTVLEAKEFKVSCVAGRKPISCDDKFVLELNIPAIVQDFSILGAGIVENIELRKTVNKKN